MTEENTTPDPTPQQHAEPANPYLATDMPPLQPGQQPGQQQGQQPGQQQGQPVHITNQIVFVQQKSTVVAYLLWLFLGQLGIHKFYVNKNGMGIIYLLLGIVGWATTFLLIGWPILAVLWVLLLIDLFTIPGSVAAANHRAAAGIRH